MAQPAEIHLSHDSLNLQKHLQSETLSFSDIVGPAWGIKPSDTQLNKQVELSSIPLPTVHERADGLASAVARSGGSGPVFLPNERDEMHGGMATNTIFNRIGDATSHLTTREIAAAKKVFEGLSPDEQKAVEKEAHSLSIRLLDSKPPKTPHFDHFTKLVERAIDPIEKERQVEAIKVLKGLPKDLVKEKQQEDFYSKHIRAL